MSAIQVTARFTVHDGKLTEFKQLAERCMALVREKDSGTLQYDWFASDDSSVFVVLETYRDSAAWSEHVENLGDTLGEVLAIADLTLEVFGTPSPELAASLAEMSATVYSPFQSI